MKDQREKGPHILNASANLLGICFIVITSLKVLNISSKSVIDEITTVAIILFMISTLLSFLSIRSRRDTNYRLERIAEYFFIGGIGLLFITTLLFSFNVIV